jgi:cell division protein FtsB
VSRRTLLLLFVVGIIGYFAVAFTNKAMDNYQVKKRAESLRQEVAALQQENKQLSDSLQYYASDQFIEKEAREKLNMARPGEHTLVVVGPTPTPQAGASTTVASAVEAPPRYNWQRWWHLFARDR